MIVLWAPYLQHDSKQTAQRASAYVTDTRTEHFWDLWRFGTRVYSRQLGLPEGDAWDMFTFYKPHLLWKSDPPEPTFWMQNRGLKYGKPYSKEALESEINNWIQ